jgi:hypothetical protein
MDLPNLKKFNFPEMFNDNNGKTQAVLVCGVAGFFAGLTGLLVCAIAPMFIPSLKLEKAPEIIALFKDSRGDFITLALTCYAGVTAHIFSKDKPLNTPDTASLPKPATTTTEIKSDGVEMKETVQEYKSPDHI